MNEEILRRIEDKLDRSIFLLMLTPPVCIFTVIMQLIIFLKLFEVI